ncbi:MAG: hypothetical protein LBJ45_02680 [Holosporaceae bacterium]|jgi:hypothetical protein|nr:hypothetical protein [Holosporaceae bacterium]
MKDTLDMSEMRGTSSAASFLSVTALLAASGGNLWKKQQTVKLPYAGNLVFYGVEDVEKYADRLSSYGRN